MAVVIINPNSTASMTDAMVAGARRAVPDLAFEGWTSVKGPASIQGAEDGARASGPLLELVAQASSGGADAIIIGCFDDTALAEAARLARCPVIGLGQASYHYAALRNWRFSVVTTLDVSVPVLEQNIAQAGLKHCLGRVRAAGVPVLELEARPSAAADLVLREAQTAARVDAIDAVVLGCAGMVQVTEMVQAHLSIPAVDPVTCAARCATWLAQSNALINV